MGKKYGRYLAIPSGVVIEDPREAFEVVGSSIVTYATHTEGMLWWREKVYERSSTQNLTPDAEVRVSGKHGTSGDVEVVGRSVYCVFGDADAFAREVKDAIQRLR